MDSPLSDVLAYIYIVFLESGLFKNIFPSNSNNFRDIDVILLIYLQELNLISTIGRLNNIELSIKFAYESNNLNLTILFG